MSVPSPRFPGLVSTFSQVFPKEFAAAVEAAKAKGENILVSMKAWLPKKDDPKKAKQLLRQVSMGNKGGSSPTAGSSAAALPSLDIEEVGAFMKGTRPSKLDDAVKVAPGAPQGALPQTSRKTGPPGVGVEPREEARGVCWDSGLPPGGVRLPVKRSAGLVLPNLFRQEHGKCPSDCRSATSRNRPAQTYTYGARCSCLHLYTTTRATCPHAPLHAPLHHCIPLCTTMIPV